MKIALLFLALFLGAFAVSMARTSTNPAIEKQTDGLECIHAGAVFAKKEGEIDIILIETWDNKFYLGNSWSQPFAIYSTFHRTGGASPAECLAYMRAAGYKYQGKAVLAKWEAQSK